MQKSRLWLKRDTLREFVNAFPAENYDVRWIANEIEHNKGRKVLQVYKRRAILRPGVVRFLTAHNDGAPWKGDKGQQQPKRHIFIRPVDSSVIRVDDLSEDAIDQMVNDGLPFSLVVETSPNNYQVWCKLSVGRDSVSTQDATTVLRYLTDIYGGDPGAATGNAVGRLPGFFNRKEKYADRHGHGPLVAIRRKKDCRGTWSRERFERVLSDAKAHRSYKRSQPTPAARHCEISFGDIDIDSVKMSPGAAFEMYEDAIADYKEKFETIDRSDRSAVDFRVARNLFFNGFSINCVAAVLMHASEKAQESDSNYLALTVRNAWSSYLEYRKRRAA